jgi:hypothetical protein
MKSVFFFGSLFCDDFPVTILYSVDDTIDDDYTRTNIHALTGIRTDGLSGQAIKAYATDRAATGTGHEKCEIS